MQITVKTEKGHKGKSFSANVLAIAFASGLWEAGKAQGPSHPVLMVFACSPGETVPVREALKLGHSTLLHSQEFDNEEIAFGRDHGYICSEPSRVHGADVTVMYVPDLCDYQPGSIGDTVHFVVMPAEVDVNELLRDRDAEIDAAIRHAHVAIPLKERRECGYRFEINRAFVGDAAIFVRYLAQRAECPPYPGLAFATQLYASAIARSTPLLTLGDGLSKARANAHSLRHIGFRSHVHPAFRARKGFAFKATQAETSAWMIEQIKRYDSVREQIVRAPALEVIRGQI
ncbi:hypothetical protein EKK58_05150 [Candidatus Dependentiae bacterium]|nr:MAG: hypothetical protein EKK58_05150 [Candidatus Dependentiae bacterium]